MNEKEKQELLTLIAEYGTVLHRGHELASRLVMLEIQKRVKEMPPTHEDNPE